MMILRLCFALLALMILPSACVGSSYPACPVCPVTTTAGVPDCGPPVIANPGWKLRSDRPDLPEGVVCLKGPLAIPVSDYAVNAPFRDPDHCWTPGAHSGTDLRADAGKTILASAAGVVVAVSQEYKDAWTVEVRFGEGWSYKVVHLSDIAVKVGDTVDVGDVLGSSGGEKGKAGSGPYTTGAHLHFSLIYQGAYVDAEKYFCRAYPRSQGKRACPKVCP